MKKRIKTLLDIILPSKRINYFIMTTIILGVISGSIFLMILSDTDKNLVIEQITNFFNNINSINSGLAFKNALIVNFTYIIIIWILGMSMLGIIINIFATYLKGFILGFSISSLILTYSYKGIMASFIYVIPTQIFNILITLILGVYSIMFTIILFRQIFQKKNISSKLFFKKYLIILLIVSITALISSLSEVFLMPSILKLVIKLFV